MANAETSRKVMRVLNSNSVILRIYL